ncbi:FAD dependent oxidoreductase [Eremomyces bilateralis CBS 781.70]|uniref:FAD dependent oxidoreductase n=1 Tax=Eremomyces bilateralis CBS 781.70 TaxID=1392243 RepID=A0A6G1G9R8_9PEZI|nr:FAD dependent oxidoreductase [Eremomyces bilateralis CBS 781.70]KAF1814773.1 FAD dependent oxidoreductase [Eremomyces bilateralis CBS 781.70]
MSNTVIVGAGIIGVSTAYYLSEPSHTLAQSIHLIDPADELFNCASGLAGGFLAEDWFAPSVAPLGVLSFRLHRELAEAHDGKTHWDYSRSTAVSMSGDSESAIGGSGEDWLRDGTSRARAATEPTGSEGLQGGEPAWLARGEGVSVEVISTKGSVAQIDPWKLCEWLLSKCKERGVHVHNPAHAISVAKDVRDTLSSVRIREKDGVETDLPCHRLILTAGAWTPRVFRTLFPHSPAAIPISPLAGHALLVRSPRWTAAQGDEGCHAVFATDTLGFSPEVFSRRGGRIYVAGLNSTMERLPEEVNDVGVGEGEKMRVAVERMRGVGRRMLGGEEVEVVRASMCFRPVTASGRPLLCKVPDRVLGDGLWTRGGGDGGVFISAGHGAWGISQCLGTGLVLAELVEGRKISVNITPLALATW